VCNRLTFLDAYLHLFFFILCVMHSLFPFACHCFRLPFYNSEAARCALHVNVAAVHILQNRLAQVCTCVAKCVRARESSSSESESIPTAQTANP
jgi:hypothetical protein